MMNDRLAATLFLLTATIAFGQGPIRSVELDQAEGTAFEGFRDDALIHVEPLGAQPVAMFATGRQINLPFQIVTRPMCGSDLTQVTREAVAEWAALARLRRQQGPVQVVSGGPALRGTQFNIVFNIGGSVPAEAPAALEAVATKLESFFSDPVTVTIDMDFASLGPGVIGATGSNYVEVTWPDTRDGLMNDMDPNDSIQAFVPGGSTIPVVYNADTGTVTNENRVFVTVANFNAAIGSAAGLAAGMVFNSDFSFDYDPSNGIGGGLTDFQSVAAHEVGHALGFTSGADFRNNDMEMLDVYRFQRSSNNPATEGEFTTFARLVDFNNPNDDHNSDTIAVEYRMSDGDPRQASHFREQSPVIGIMDPTLAAGESFFPDFFQVSDRAMFDAIGWDHPPVPDDVTPPSPDPMTFASNPAPMSSTVITMAATTATDDSLPVQYYFEETSGNPGGSDSGWQAPTTYQDSGLTPNTMYSYSAKARDSETTPNETTPSGVESTASAIQTPVNMGFQNLTGSSVELVAAGAYTNLGVGASGLFFDSLTEGGDGGINVWQQSTTATVTGLMQGTLYEFRVKARNQLGVETAYSNTLQVFTPQVFADCNNDGVLDDDDVPCFVNALLGTEDVPGAFERCDLTFDGQTNGGDMEFFLFCLITQGC
jgi:hypothetical protein